MKLTAIIMLAALMQVNAAGYAQKITILAENASLGTIFKDIRNQSGYNFLYNNQMIKEANPITISVKNASIENVLNECFKGQPLNFTIFKNTVVIKRKTNYQSIPQDVDVSGKVVDENGVPIPGVTVWLKNKLGTTLTDQNGNFSIKSDLKDIITFSYIGYKNQEIKLYNSKELNIIMQPEVTGLGEVVVVGYGTQKKENLTGAVDQIDAKKLESQPVANLSQALQGVSPNLNITFNDGHPGSGGTFNIRGFASITNNTGSPLVLIDGAPGNINNINPHDVESISILKDAASSAVYGARGAFGVILVTTKNGKNGKLSVNYSTNFSLQTPTTNTDFMTDGYTQAKLTDEAFIRSTGAGFTNYTEKDYEELKKRQTDPSLPSVVIDNRNGKDMYIYYGNTDWWSTFFRDVQPSLEHALSVTGGSDKMDFLLSGRYYQQKGIMQISQDKYNAYNFRAKINAHLTPWFTLSGNTQFIANDYTYPGFGYNSNFVSTSVHELASYVPVNPDGTATYRPEINAATIGDGLAANLLHDKSMGNQINYDFMNTLGVKINLNKGITFTGNYTYDLTPYTTQLRKTAAPWSVYPGVISYVGNDQLSQNTYNNQYHAVNAFGDYEKSFGQHNLKLTTGYNQELRKFHTTTATRYNLLSEDLNELDLGTGDALVGSSASEWGLLGFFGRINYDFKSKYLLEVNGRYDGTSRFPKNNRFGFFPSVSTGWRISEESFFEPLKPIMSNLKLRGSYGSLGNQQISSSYPYIPVINSGISTYILNGNKAQYLSSPNPIDPDFTWEKTATINGGVDL
ncbi:SusC/RagA family TonB-linked outer membrane protein, partial [Arcticibacter svalbardensis]|uniref:SusC/RagA family TonB-linked outer membrane protein n=1 Tax=Arcticibacter svalbardensis TaxID=1288027 RepID=UPI001360B1F6